MVVFMDYKRALETLELNKGFTKEELKKHYKMLVKKYHPDNHEFGNQNKFIEVQEAYTYLSNLDNHTHSDIGSDTPRGESTCPMCNGNGWRREKIKTSRGYVAQKVKCNFCNGLGKK